jgi:aquaporin Z
LIAGEINAAKAATYWIAQCIGGVLGGALLYYMLGGDSSLGATVLADGVSPVQGLILEAVLTFFLVNTVLNTAVSGKAGNFAPIPIGLTLAFCILMGGPLTGASLNPARTLGPAIFSGTINLYWIYLIGPFIGGAVAALLYKGVFKEKE